MSGNPARSSSLAHWTAPEPPPTGPLWLGNDEDNDILGARHAGIDGVYLRTGISPYSDPMESQAAVLSLKGADYEGLANFLLA